MLAKHTPLFEPGLGKVTGNTAKFYVKPEAKPNVLPIMSSAVCHKEREIDRQVEERFLEPVKFSEWATPVV